MIGAHNFDAHGQFGRELVFDLRLPVDPVQCETVVGGNETDVIQQSSHFMGVGQLFELGVHQLLQLHHLLPVCLQIGGQHRLALELGF